MPEAHLRHAAGVPAGTQARPTAQHDQTAAIKLAGLVTSGLDPDEVMARVRTTVHELEHGLGSLHVDPWQVIVQLALRLAG